MKDTPDSKVHGANMGPIWGRQAPGGPHVGPMNFAIWYPFAHHEVKLRVFIVSTLTHWGWVTNICVHELGDHCFK